MRPATPRRAVVASLLPIALSVAPSAAGRHADEGITYTFMITGHGLNADGKANDYQEVASAQVSGDQVWVQFFEPAADQEPYQTTDSPEQVSGKPMFYGHGAYYLYHRGSSTMTVVSPQRKKYFELDEAAAASKLFGGVLHTELSDVTVSVARIQPDTTIDERPVRHWRVTDDHTMKVRVLALSSTQNIHATIDYYFVADLKQDFNPFLRAGSVLTYAGSEDYDKKMQAALDQMDGGVPVLSVQRSTATDNRGQGRSSLVRRVTNLARADVPPSVFVVPAGFQKAKDDREFPAERAGLPDSLTTAVSPPGSNESNGSPGSAAQKAKDILGKLHVP